MDYKTPLLMSRSDKNFSPGRNERKELAEKTKFKLAELEKAANDARNLYLVRLEATRTHRNWFANTVLPKFIHVSDAFRWMRQNQSDKLKWHFDIFSRLFTRLFMTRVTSWYFFLGNRRTCLRVFMDLFIGRHMHRSGNLRVRGARFQIFFQGYGKSKKIKK